MSAPLKEKAWVSAGRDGELNALEEEKESSDSERLRLSCIVGGLRRSRR
jgi:hypothetical protein